MPVREKWCAARFAPVRADHPPTSSARAQRPWLVRKHVVTLHEALDGFSLRRALQRCPK